MDIIERNKVSFKRAAKSEMPVEASIPALHLPNKAALLLGSAQSAIDNQAVVSSELRQRSS